MVGEVKSSPCDLKEQSGCVFLCCSSPGPVSGVLAQYFKLSSLLLAGCLLASLSVCASYFASGVPFLIITLGVFYGFGLSLLTLGYVAVNQSVSTNKALASGITIGGSVVGGIIFPPVVQCLFDAYGTRGGLLVFGALMLNSMAAALLTRGPLREAGRREKKTMSNGTAPRLSEPARKIICEARAEDNLHGDNVYDSCKGICLHNHEGTREPTLETSSSGCGGYKAASAHHAAHGTLSTHPENSVPLKSSESNLARWLSFLKNPRFYIIAYSLGQIWFLNTTLLTVIVDFALERGIGKWDAVSLVSFITAPDLVSRFVSGVVTDKGILRKSTMMFLCLGAYACAHTATPYVSSFAAIATFAAISGSCNGIAVTHIFVLCGELVPRSTFSLCMGAANFVAAFALLERPLMIGYCKDKLGSYDGLFYFMAGVSGTTAALWLFVSFQETRQKDHREHVDALAEGS
ncbi:hypothetical protein V5799_027305 [Amblyomma americanum]|uniref:Monocarboxylate transporter n=1 Tax=Amblyomma americanum TaxID=6943 RepID=A0AAQ4DG39_AMBAM